MKKIFTNIFIILFFSLSYIGCGHNLSLLPYKNIDDVKIVFTKLIFLKPTSGKNNNIFIVKNSDLREQYNNDFILSLRKNLANRGYNLVDCKKVANYMIEYNILHIGKTSEKKTLDFSDIVIAKFTNRYENVYEENIEHFISDIDNIKKGDKVISIIANMVISEKYGKNWNHYYTKIISSTKFQVLNIEETLSTLLKYMGKSVSELF